MTYNNKDQKVSSTVIYLGKSIGQLITMRLA